MRKYTGIVFSLIIIIELSCKSNTNEVKMEQEEKQIIAMCQEFAKKADELESKAFGNSDYKENGFVSDFNKLFEYYAFGKQNRTVSGLNFRQPPRYSHVEKAVSIESVKVNKSKYEVYFWAEKSFNSIKFIVQKKDDEWKLIKFQTCLKANPNESDCSWRTHKL
ncbi:hypothetical protein [Aquimarina mytili]|uniref:Uncharacterized protein n=1 Tax=Aquimarina mytili TaxID=874423 RepID=A0A937A0S2_9FLAO|nr:hypothetical protein [Aquimarina mytili]MBL0685896.1 hypothetical protein [Aquimarina mytili]